MARRTGRRGFTANQDLLVLRLDDTEARVLAHLVEQLATLLDAPRPDTGDPLAELLDLADGARPSDPAVLRLFPDAYRDDDDAATDFRRFTERGLRTAKVARLAVMRDVLGRFGAATRPLPVPVTDEEGAAFLGGLNDVRLVLGARLGLVSDDHDVTAGWDEDDPRWSTFAAYQWLTWLQGTLLEALGA